jgi:hypothetical protein
MRLGRVAGQLAVDDGRPGPAASRLTPAFTPPSSAVMPGSVIPKTVVSGYQQARRKVERAAAADDDDPPRGAAARRRGPLTLASISTMTSGPRRRVAP